MAKRQRRLAHLRWYCDLAIEAARLQRTRVLAGGTTRHDLDFYLLTVWRLSELAREAAEMHVPGASEIHAEMIHRWPLLNEVRNWWVHATHLEWSKWFAESVYVFDANGNQRPVVHVLQDHDEVERFYERLHAALQRGAPVDVDESDARRRRQAPSPGSPDGAG